MVRSVFVSLIFILAACSGSDTIHVPVETKNGTACNPFSMGACALPIPSSMWEKEDSDTVTGRRLDLPAALLPQPRASTPSGKTAFDAAPYNRADGWTPGMSIFLTFDRAIDDSNLVPYAEIADSVEPGSTTVLLDAETGERVGHFAELDKNLLVDQSGPAYADRGLLIRPAGPLKTNRRYIVAITNELRAKDGERFASPPAFAALRDGKATDHDDVESLRSSYGEMFDALTSAGVPQSKLLIAWDFHTASDDYLERDILAMREQALAMLGKEGISYQIDSVQPDNDDSRLHLRIEGTYESPLFLQDGGDYSAIYCNADLKDCPPPVLVRDEAGLPELQGTWQRPFIITIPAAATGGTLPVVQFGHGLLGGGGEILSGYYRDVAQELGMVFAATDWTGLAFDDVPAVTALLQNFNRLPTLTDRLGQGLIDAMALTRTLHQIKRDPALEITNPETSTAHPAYETEEIFFYGISLGGTQGGSFMTLTKDIQKGILNVPGAAWSLMFQRSSNWNFYSSFMNLGYPNSMDQQILLVLSQVLFDFSDPIAYAHRTVENRFHDTPAKQILLQQAVEDSQVPNMATEKMARGMGVPVITPAPREVWGMETATEAPSALTVWDENATPKTPIANIPPPDDNGTHGTNRRLPEVTDEIERFFFLDGKIGNACGGPCNYVNDELQTE